MKTSHLVFLALLITVGLGCRSQKTAPTFDFNELTFHSSSCNGSCPDISLNINSEGSIRLIRIFYQSKGVEDTVNSGSFKGSLDTKNYQKLQSLLKEVDWQAVTFPDVTCCDKPVVQILLTFDSKMHKFRSMQPPSSTHKLIEFLTHLSTTIKLPRYDKAMDFEMILD